MPVAIGGDNLPSLVGLGLTDLPNIGGASGPPGHPGSGITAVRMFGFAAIKQVFSLSTTIMLLSPCYTRPYSKYSCELQANKLEYFVQCNKGDNMESTEVYVLVQYSECSRLTLENNVFLLLQGSSSLSKSELATHKSI